MKFLFQSLYDAAKFAAECDNVNYDDLDKPEERLKYLKTGRTVMLAEGKIIENIYTQKLVEAEILKQRLQVLDELRKSEV